MSRSNKFCFFVVGLLLLFAPSKLFAQDIQTVTVTVGELSKTQYTFEPKEIKIKPGKVQFVLVNKPASEANHNLAVKLKDKEIRLVRATPGQTEKSEIIDLPAGEYDIYCSFTSGGNHKEKGMAGKLIVK